MLNDLFYAVLGMLPWTCALIAALLVLRHFARAALSARFFRLAWLILAVRLALPVSFAVPVQDRLKGQVVKAGDLAQARAVVHPAPHGRRPASGAPRRPGRKRRRTAGGGLRAR